VKNEKKQAMISLGLSAIITINIILIWYVQTIKEDIETLDTNML